MWIWSIPDRIATISTWHVQPLEFIPNLNSYSRGDQGMNIIFLARKFKFFFPCCNPKIFFAFCIIWSVILIDSWCLFFAIFLRRDQRGETTTLTIEREGLFDISVTKILKEALLQPEAIFQCLLTIPETTFIRREETMYFPGKGKPYFNRKNLLKITKPFSWKKF